MIKDYHMKYLILFSSLILIGCSEPHFGLKNTSIKVNDTRNENGLNNYDYCINTDFVTYDF